MALSIVKYIEDKFIKVPNYLISITARENFDSFKELKRLIENISTNVKYRKYQIGDKKSIILTINAQSKDPEFSIKILQNLSKFKEIEKITIN